MSKPCKGFPSQAAAVLDLLGKGASAAEIVAETGLSGIAVNRAMARADIRPVHTRLAVRLETYQGLEQVAQARGSHPVRLITRLLDVIVQDKLLDAILDDG